MASQEPAWALTFHCPGSEEGWGWDAKLQGGQGHGLEKTQTTEKALLKTDCLQKTSNSQSDLEKEEWNGRNQPT